MRIHSCLALLILSTAPCFEAAAEEILLYTTKNPDQVRGVRANGNRDRLLFKGSLSDFRTKTELGRYIVRHEVLGPTRFRTSIQTKERWGGSPSRREWRVIETHEGQERVLVPWSPRPLSITKAASHRGRYFFYKQCVTEDRDSPDYLKEFDLHVVETDGSNRTRVARSVAWATWATLPEDAILKIETLPAEVWLERKERLETIPARTAAWNEGGAERAVPRSAKEALAAMAPADRDAFQVGFDSLKARLKETRLTYNFTVYARPNRATKDWACVAASRDRAIDLSSRLNERWTLTSVERWRLTGASQPGWHTSNVAVFNASDGQTIHVSVDNYVGLVECYVLGTSEADWPKAWKRSGSNADYRRGQALTSSSTDEDISGQARSELTALQAQERNHQRAEFDPPLALARGVTFLPFRVSLKALDGDPHSGRVVTISTSSPSCSLSETRKLTQALTEPQRSKTKIELTVGGRGETKVVYLVVKDPALEHDLGSVSVTVEGEGSKVEQSWKVEDSLKKLLETLRLRAAPVPPSSAAALGAQRGGPSERGTARGNSLSGKLSDLAGHEGRYRVERRRDSGARAKAGPLEQLARPRTTAGETLIEDALKPLAGRDYPSAIKALRDALQVVESPALRVGLAEAYLGEARRLTSAAKLARAKRNPQKASRLRKLARDMRISSGSHLNRAPKQALEQAAALEAAGNRRASLDLYRATLIASGGRSEAAREGLVKIYRAFSRANVQRARHRDMARAHLLKLESSSDPKVAARARRELRRMSREVPVNLGTSHRR
tara:strand:- start:561 stop:2918 length:2358 start_codon:yes stop_codon:yes gene_type:complete